MKIDLFHIDFIKHCTPFVSSFSNEFKSYLLEIIDKRMLLIRNNIVGLAHIVTGLKNMFNIDKLFWVSLEEHLAENLNTKTTDPNYLESLT